MYQADLHHPDQALEKKLQHLYGLHRTRAIDPGFRPPFLKLLEQLGNPHRALPPVIHVAGTNGKGSIIAILRAILEKAGYKVHAYTSPHLCAFNERIVLAGQPITNETLSSLIDEAVRLNDAAEITFFEITTAMAFAAFARTPADIVLLETGMGGRLDCTNIIEKPLVTIINAIGYDHMEHLGNTLWTIAGEKAGIMKQGVPCVIGAQSALAQKEGVMKLFREHAQSLKVPLVRAGAEWVTIPSKTQLRFVFKFEDRIVDRQLPLPALQGLHQVDNAGAALAALEVITAQIPTTEAARAEGLLAATWPGRLQNITALLGHLSPRVPSGWEVWIDGAHNTDGARVLSTQLDTWQQTDPKPAHIVAGMMAHKDPVPFLQIVSSRGASLSFMDIPHEPKSHSAADLKKLADKEGIGPSKTGTRTYPDYESAIKSITRTAQSGRIIFTGSLYLIGHILKKLS